MDTLKSYVEWKLTHADKTAKAEGYPLTLENCKKNKKMKQLEIYGNSVQDGTPTPDNPIEVQSVGEKTVNLFDKDNFERQFAYINMAQNWYYYSADSSSVAIPCKPNTTYSISHNINTPIFRVCYIASDVLPAPTGSQAVEAFDCTQASTDETLNVTTGTDCTYLIVQCASSVFDEFIATLQIQEGSTATPYEPYGKYKIPVVQRGVNIADMNTLKSNVCIDNGNGTYTLTKTTSNRNTGTMYVDIKAGSVIRGSCNFEYSGTYYTSSNVKFHWLIRYVDETNGYLNLSPNSNIVEVTATKDVQYIRGYIQNTDSDGAYYTFKDLMITVDTEFEHYEPYVEPVTTNIFLDEPLRKLGNYADYIDFKEKKVHRLIHESYLDGNQATGYSGSKYYIAPAVRYYYTNPISGLCNRFVVSDETLTDKAYISGSSSGAVLYINNSDLLGISDSASLQRWFRNNPTVFVHILEIPTEESISCDLPELNAKTTIIEVDTSLLPSDAYGKYIKI